MAYATVSEVRAYIEGVDLSDLGTTAEQDSAISAAADLATLRVERRTRRSFTPVTETRTFDGTGSVRLLVPDLISITGWTMDGIAQDVSNLTRYPLNVTPTLWLLMKYGVFTLGNANIEITGAWGYANAVPADITNAAAMIAAAMIAAADVLTRISPATGSGMTAVSQGGLSQRYDDGAFGAEIRRLERSAEGLLAGFRRITC